MKQVSGKVFNLALYAQEPGVAEAELEADVRRTLHLFLYAYSGRDNLMNAQMRTTLVFIHQHEQWHLAGVHFCNIGQPPPFARS
jgi:hypothetical protein